MLLIGVKKENNSVSNFSTEGYGGTTINSTNFDVIEENSDKEVLKKF